VQTEYVEKWYYFKNVINVYKNGRLIFEVPLYSYMGLIDLEADGKIQDVVLWIVTPCSYVVRYKCFGAPRCFYLQGG
jgi:hypothetical protein